VGEAPRAAAIRANDAELEINRQTDRAGQRAEQNRAVVTVAGPGVKRVAWSLEGFDAGDVTDEVDPIADEPIERAQLPQRVVGADAGLAYHVDRCFPDFHLA